MDDLIKRLKQQNSYNESGVGGFHIHDPVCSEAADEIERLRDTLSNLSNAAAIVFSHFEPKDGPSETAKALLKMELGLKD